MNDICCDNDFPHKNSYLGSICDFSFLFYFTTDVTFFSTLSSTKPFYNTYKTSFTLYPYTLKNRCCKKNSHLNNTPYIQTVKNTMAQNEIPGQKHQLLFIIIIIVLSNNFSVYNLF